MNFVRCGRCGLRVATKSRTTAREWFGGHKAVCAAAAPRPTGLARPFEAELAQLVATARRYKPIVVPTSDASSTWTESTEWTDTARDRWGAQARGPQLLARQWSSGNCLKGCIASVLGAPIERVPDPTREFNEGLDGWLERYDARLQKDVGYRLEVIPAHACPPRNRSQLWLACIRMDGPADHVVVARNNCVVFDPLGEFMGLLPMRRLVDGMIVTPAQRVIPVFSPHRCGRMVVPA